MDSRLRIETLRATPNPQQAVWAAMHQDYCEDFVYDRQESFPSEEKAGELIVKHLLSGGRGHYGCLEHVNIQLNVGWFPHAVMQQLRTHRVGVTFDVQSFRYTGKRIVDVANGKRDVEDVFYLRPVDHYTDRQGKKYFYSEEQRQEDLEWCMNAARHYKKRIEQGLSEEHARSIIPFDTRQHFVVTCNIRSAMHLLDLRWKKDAQLECQWFCDLAFKQINPWMPAICQWYEANRAKKARLAP